MSLFVLFVLIAVFYDLDVLLGRNNKYTGCLNILQISGLSVCTTLGTEEEEGIL